MPVDEKRRPMAIIESSAIVTERDATDNATRRSLLPGCDSRASLLRVAQDVTIGDEQSDQPDRNLNNGKDAKANDSGHGVNPSIARWPRPSNFHGSRPCFDPRLRIEILFRPIQLDRYRPHQPTAVYL